MFRFTGGRGRPALVCESPKKLSECLKTEVSVSGFLLTGLVFDSLWIGSNRLRFPTGMNQIKSWLEAFRKYLNQFNSQFKWTPKSLTPHNSRLIKYFRNLNQFKAQLMMHWSRPIWIWANDDLNSVTSKFQSHQSIWFDSIRILFLKIDSI